MIVHCESRPRPGCERARTAERLVAWQSWQQALVSPSRLREVSLLLRVGSGTKSLPDIQQQHSLSYLFTISVNTRLMNWLGCGTGLCSLWNSLPADIVSCDTLPRFRRELKTFLFRQSYPSILLWFFSVDLAVFT